MNKTRLPDKGPIDINEKDIIEAMKDLEGYIDISPGDFREIFLLAYQHAVERLTQFRTAAEIMSRQVHCVDVSMDLRQTAMLLADRGVSGAPVVDDAGLLVGVVSEKDFLVRMGIGSTPTFMQIIAHCLNNKGCVVTELRNHGVAEIMSAPPISAGEEITIADMATLFARHRINRLPIVDTARRPIGIVTRTDLVLSHCPLDSGGRS